MVLNMSVQLMAVAAVSLAGLAFLGTAALLIGVMLYRPGKGKRRRLTTPVDLDNEDRKPR